MIPRMSGHDRALQDYRHDLFSGIVSGDAVFGNVIDTDNCSYDLGGRLFKTSKVDHAGRSVHLNILDLEGVL